MPTTVSGDVSIGDNITAAQYNALRDDAASLVTAASTEITISATGTITYVTGQAFYRIDTYGDGATDDLDTISGGAEGDIVLLVAENVARVVTIKNATGNLDLGSDDCDLDADESTIMLMKSSGGDWLELCRCPKGEGNVPVGMIILRADNCPAGWTRFTALDGKFPKGASSYGGTGGATNHTHAYSEIIAHTHAGGTLAGASDGAHTHSAVSVASTGTDAGPHGGQVTGTGTGYTSSSGAHTHTLNGNTANTGIASPTSDSQDHLPQYLDMIFCKKD